MSAAIIAFAWLFLGRAIVRMRLASRSSALLAGVRGGVEQRLSQAARASIEGRQKRLSKCREALGRLQSVDAIWRHRLHGEEL